MSSKRLMLKSINNHTAFKSSKGYEDRDLADLISDIVNTSSMTYSEIAEICNLSPSTIKRISLCEKPYSPNSETVKKICKAFEFYLELK